MNDNSLQQTQGQPGFLSEDVEELIKNQIGSQTLEFLQTWAELTRKSLKANKEVLFNCLTVDVDDGHILCRFCGEGIPNWKQDNAREHKSECPMNTIGEVMVDSKKLYKELSEQIESNK